MFKGSCLCGKIKYQTSELNGPYVYCHCTSCRKANGSAFAANISSPIQAFEIVLGSGALTVYESTPGKLRHFCSYCGSPIFTTVGTSPKVVRIRLGTLDTVFEEKAAGHIFVEEAPPWHEISDRLPHYERWPDRHALKIPGSRQSE